VRRFATIALAAAAVTFVVLRAGGVQANETFVLEEKDRIIAETPGCHAECRVQGARRICAIQSFDCRAVCQEIPECSPHPTARHLRVCAIVKSRP
jgi:hypothetical protein